MHPRSHPAVPLDRRTFFIRGSRRGAGLVVAGVGLPTLLAACAADDPVISERTTPPPSATPLVTPSEAAEQARAIVGDVIEFELTSEEWPGDFGFVTMQLHTGVVDDSDVYFIRTDASDEDYAAQEQLVWVPRIGLMARDDLTGTAVMFDNPADGQPTVLSSEPGRDDYTPAWLLTRARWSGEPQLLRSLDEVQEAAVAGALELTETDIVLNAAVVKWSSGELPADTTERTAYLGPGQLLEPPDTTAMRVTFKLNQCFPGSRYIVTDHSMEMAATMTSTNFAPKLQGGPTEAGATGRTNVFGNGIAGPGPMGFQPSAFDLDAGESAWSPYWDHFTYVWADGGTPRLLTSESEIHAARDAGELEEFPGTPDTDGEVFTVNCPVPVLAPPSFQA